MGMRVRDLKKLREELDVDEPASDLLQLPDVLGPLLRLDLRPHLAHIRGEPRSIARAAKHLADRRLDLVA